MGDNGKDVFIDIDNFIPVKVQEELGIKEKFALLSRADQRLVSAGVVDINVIWTESQVYLRKIGTKPGETTPQGDWRKESAAGLVGIPIEETAKGITDQATKTLRGPEANKKYLLDTTMVNDPNIQRERGDRVQPIVLKTSELNDIVTALVSTHRNK